MKCTCGTHSRTEPGYVSCHVDHDSVAERNSLMRAALLASPKFREEAFAHEGTEAITSPADPGITVAAAVEAVVSRYIDWLVARACVKAAWGESTDMIEHVVLTKECSGDISTDVPVLGRAA